MVMVLSEGALSVTPILYPHHTPPSRGVKRFFDRARLETPRSLEAATRGGSRVTETSPAPSTSRRSCGVWGARGLPSSSSSVCEASSSPDWLEIRAERTEAFAVIGYTPPKGSRRGSGGLHLARPTPDSGWRYVDRVGSGFSSRPSPAPIEKPFDTLRSGVEEGTMMKPKWKDVKIIHVDPHCGPFVGDTLEIEGVSHIVVARGFLGDGVTEIWAIPSEHNDGNA